jgi:predicted ester cyclase
MGKATVRGFYSMVFGAFPGSQLTIDEEIVDDDRMALRFTQRGTHNGVFRDSSGSSGSFHGFRRLGRG